MCETIAALLLFHITASLSKVIYFFPFSTRPPKGPNKSTLNKKNSPGGPELSPVSRAVHGLEGKDLLLHLEGEHVLAVVLPVSGGHPQLAVVDVRRHHLLEASVSVLALSRKSQTVD